MKILFAEALWDDDISESRLSYRSLLGLIRNETGCKLSHFTFNTPEELDYLFEIFGTKNYDIFYLASHMEKGKALSGLKKKFSVEYVPLILKHKKSLGGKILHLAGCSSLNREFISPENVIEMTGLEILSGYEIDTDTSESSAMEVLYFAGILNEGGIPVFLSNMKTVYKGLVEQTGFTIYMGNEYELTK